MVNAQRDEALRSLFQPRSVAVIGASADPGKWGYMMTKCIMTGSHRRSVSLVNRAGKPILGLPSVPSVRDLDVVPDLAVVTVPGSVFEETINELLEIGTRSIIAVTAGFGETGEEGRARQEKVMQRVREHDAVLLGPNCTGVFDAEAEFNALAWSNPAPGSVGIISQSGSVLMDVADRLHEVGLGVSRAASVGNQADVTIGDLIRISAADEATKALILYVEDAIDGRALYRDIAFATAAGTPVIVLTPNAHESVNRAAMSHTGALVSPRAVIEEAATAAGALSVSSLPAAVHMAQAVLSPVRAAGIRTAIVTDAGGFGVLSASEAASAGLDVPTLPEETQAILAKQLLPGAGVANPVDLVGAMDVRDMPSMVATILDSDAVDCALVTSAAFVHDTPELEEEVGRALAGVARASGKPIVLCALDPTTPGPRAAAAAGLPVYRDMQPAAAALAALAALYNSKPTPPPSLPPAATALTLDPLDYLGAREALETAGLSFPRSIRATTPEEAVRLSDSLGYPVVLKALGLLHKSDSGGVALGLRTADDVLAAATLMRDSLNPAGFAVEEMVDMADSVELIVGGHQDPRFGPVILIGLGGVYSEILRDTAVLLAPTTEAAVVEKLKGLRGAALLQGARGKPPVQIDAIADCVVRLGDFMASHPEIMELDVNPLLCGPAGALALDARIVI